jgi:Gametolysin peptidase M11
MRVLAGALALAALLSSGALAAGSQVSPTLGEQRIGVVLATWGPEPVTVEEARDAIAATDAYVREASFGKTWLDAELIGWVRPLPARPTGCSPPAMHDTISRSVDLSSFDRVAYVLPEIDCPWGGAYFPPGVWMLGRITMELFAHELGHNYGIAEEGAAWICDGRSCRAQDYASPYSVMGHGSGHYNAFEKWRFGWIERAGPSLRSGDVEIARIDRPSELPHALYVVSGPSEYWLEYRPEVGWPVVYAGPTIADGGESRYPRRNLLLASARQATFAVPGSFEAKLTRADGESATLSFRWTDRRPPSRPRVGAEVARGRVTVSFSATDAGSGVERFEIVVDRTRRVTVPTSVLRGGELIGRLLQYRARLPRGLHRIAVVAIDRAGNRSPRAVTRVTVR